jgi:hypothetical protein
MIDSNAAVQTLHSQANSVHMQNTKQAHTTQSHMHCTMENLHAGSSSSSCALCMLLLAVSHAVPSLARMLSVQCMYMRLTGRPAAVQ